MTYAFEDFELDETRFRLSRAGVPVAIQPRPLQLLLLLVKNRQRLVRRQEVLDALWPGLQPSQASLDRAIRAARRALGDRGHAPRYIATVRNVGFRFLPEVSGGGAGAGEPAVPGPEALDLALEVAELALASGRRELAQRRSLDAAELARAGGDDAALVRAAVLLSRATGSPAEGPGRSLVEEALARIDGSEDPRRDELSAYASRPDQPPAGA